MKIIPKTVAAVGAVGLIIAAIVAITLSSSLQQTMGNTLFKQQPVFAAFNKAPYSSCTLAQISVGFRAGLDGKRASAQQLGELCFGKAYPIGEHERVVQQAAKAKYEASIPHRYNLTSIYAPFKNMKGAKLSGAYDASGNQFTAWHLPFTLIQHRTAYLYRVSISRADYNALLKHMHYIGGPHTTILLSVANADLLVGGQISNLTLVPVSGFELVPQ